MTELDELVQRLREGKNWLNEGRCCGDVDSNGVCAAPACIFGDALKEFSEAADALEHMAASHDALVAEIDALRKERDEAFQKYVDANEALIDADEALIDAYASRAFAASERDAAIARAVKAEKERDAISTRFEKALVEGTKRREERDALRTALVQAVEALEFYANPEPYRPDTIGRVGDLTYSARTVLSDIKKMMGGMI